MDAQSGPQRNWITRLTAVVGVLLAAFSLFLTINWHRQEIEDRILVRVGAFQPSHYPLNSTMPKFSSEGKLDVEVVNIGMRPIYIQDVEVKMASTDFVLYQHGPAAMVSEAMKSPLAPGQPVDYKMDWDFSQNPLDSMWREIKKNDLWVHVETTRRSFDVPVTNIYFSTNSFLNLELIQPSQK